MALLDDFEQLDLDGLNGFVDRQQEENLFLDFKLVQNAAFTSADDRKNLAKALSGFANSSGGLIVWGVDARPNAQRIDCAIGLQEIQPVQLMIARLNELTSRAVDPRVDGVRHKPIISQGERGFAVTLVPESSAGPHMAKCREDRYYKRSGETFYKMEHFDVADMFGRRKRPQLVLTARVSRPRDEIVLSIKNEGRATAKAPYVFIEIPNPFGFALYGLDGNGHDGLPRLPHSDSASHRRRYGGNLDTVVHPNTIHDVTKIEYRGREEARPHGEILIRYEIAAEDMQLLESAITVNIDDLG